MCKTVLFIRDMKSDICLNLYMTHPFKLKQICYELVCTGSV